MFGLIVGTSLGVDSWWGHALDSSMTGCQGVGGPNRCLTTSTGLPGDFSIVTGGLEDVLRLKGS